MEYFRLADSIRAKGKEYRVETRNLVHENKIICSLFEGGKVLDRKELDYVSSLGEPDVLRLLRSIHQEMIKGLENLCQISETVAQREHAVSRYRIGRVFYEKRMYEEAINQFSEAIQLDSRLVEAYLGLGLTYTAIGLLDEAIHIYRKCLALQPEYADVHCRLGQAYRKKTLLSEAIIEFQKAIDLNPRYEEAYYYLSLTSLEQMIDNKKTGEKDLENVTQKIVPLFQKVAQLNPRVQNQHFLQGMDFLLGHQLESAREEFSRARVEGLQPHGSEIWNDLYLKFMYQTPQLDENLLRNYVDKLKMILEENPYYADMNNYLGVAYVVQSRYFLEKAIAQFRKALEINPQYREAQRNLSLVNNESRGFMILLRTILG